MEAGGHGRAAEAGRFRQALGDAAPPAGVFAGVVGLAEGGLHRPVCEGVAACVLRCRRISGNAVQIGFAAQLWQVFRALISGALDELKTLLGDAATLVMETIEAHVQGFFVQALQLDPRTLRLEAK